MRRADHGEESDGQRRRFEKGQQRRLEALNERCEAQRQE
jgi:hypothetical protein